MKLIKCDKCINYKPDNLFYKSKYCKRCHIKDYLKTHLFNAQIANNLNISIDELNNIMKIDPDDKTRNELGEHEKYYDIIEFITKGYKNSIITDEIINNFLDETI